MITLIHNALLILGIKYATSEGQILGGINEAPLPYWIQKPLFSCTYCMSSFWGFVYGFSRVDDIIVHCIMLCGLLVITGALIEFLQGE